MRRTEQTSFNVSFQKKKVFSHVTGSLEYNNFTEDPGSFLLFILLVSMCVLHTHMYGSSITCMVQASHVQFRHHMYTYQVQGQGKDHFFYMWVF